MTLKQVKRVDRPGSLGKVERTPQGGIRVPAKIARVGILEYNQLIDGKWVVIKEYNPPEVLAAALASLRDAPVTDDHPSDGVSPDNYRRVVSGQVSSDLAFSDNHIAGTLAIQDAALINKINAGKREVSAGYSATVDYTPGVTPEGQAYDGIRVAIEYNHVAVVAEGRAGPTVRLMLDSAGNAATVDLDQPTEPTIESQSTELHSKPNKDEAMELVEALAALEAANGKVAALEADLTSVRGEMVAALDPAKMDAAVSARIVLVDSARKVLGAEFKADGLSTVDVHKAVVAKAYPAIKLDGKSPEFVAGMYEAAVSKSVEDTNDGAAAIRSALVPPTAPPATVTDSVDAARAAMLKRNADRSKGKLSASK